MLWKTLSYYYPFHALCKNLAVDEIQDVVWPLE